MNFKSITPDDIADIDMIMEGILEKLLEYRNEVAAATILASITAIFRMISVEYGVPPSCFQELLAHVIETYQKDWDRCYPNTDFPPG